MCLLNCIVYGTWFKYTKEIITIGYMTAKRSIANKLKEELWLQTFLEVISREEAASNHFEVSNEEQLTWKFIIEIFQ